MGNLTDIAADIRINTEEKTIAFSGKLYTGWGNIRWLRTQFALMEHNAVALWGTELVQAHKDAEAKADEARAKFTVINGDKEGA